MTFGVISDPFNLSPELLVTERPYALSNVNASSSRQIIPSKFKLKPRFSRTLSYSKGVPVAQIWDSEGHQKKPFDFWTQNAVLNDERLAEQTYGPKRPVIEKVRTSLAEDGF
ncbi:hypothetical protein CEXT_697231 [Caerostris extrusa]|uniref:Uncharacterized protein n=1 Tax=Caerostris extrusa TaxID=172846 RepID=A0AAV4RIS6_CAEEX|nr:hypothetical protein CEXT_697231 [Caerostris extrusa]